MRPSPADGLVTWDRPVRPGLPLSARPGLVGTLGAIARDRRNGAALALATSHVLCPAGEACGAAVWQPGPCDQKGCDCNRVGVASRGRRGVVTHGGHRYFVDCAVARLDADVDWDASFGGRRLGGVGRARRGARVWKLGAGSGETAGVVLDDRHEEVALEADGYRPYPNQLLIQPLTGAGGGRFSVVGDSGALMCDDAGRAVGLLWGASAVGYALACPIEPVLEALAIDLETS
jgi:hypothetical protein